MPKRIKKPSKAELTSRIQILRFGEQPQRSSTWPILSQKQIASLLDCSPSRVSRLIKEHAHDHNQEELDNMIMSSR